MGTNCAPLFADLFLFCYERGFMMSLSDYKQANIFDALTSSRYLDDICNINYIYFENMKSKGSLALPCISRLEAITGGHSIDLDDVAAHPIGALLAYADLAEFQPRRGRGKACFDSSKYSCTVFARLQRLSTHPRSCDWRKWEEQMRQRRTSFWCQKNTAK